VYNNTCKDEHTQAAQAGKNERYIIMTQTTIDRIHNAALLGSTIVIGRYTYKQDLNTGIIWRCKTDNIGRRWINSDGRQYDAWERV
jgi:hypothetical protein